MINSLEDCRFSNDQLEFLFRYAEGDMHKCLNMMRLASFGVVLGMRGVGGVRVGEGLEVRGRDRCSVVYTGVSMLWQVVMFFLVNLGALEGKAEEHVEFLGMV